MTIRSAGSAIGIQMPTGMKSMGPRRVVSVSRRSPTRMSTWSDNPAAAMSARASATLAGSCSVPNTLASGGSPSWCGGVGLCMVANTSLATGAAAPHEAGLISGLVNAARQIGGSLGLAILTTVAATQGAPSAPADRVHQLVTGYDRAFLVTTGFCAAAAVVAAVFAPRGHREEPSAVPGPAAEQDHASA
ncbi:hypothetical protein [Streptomyces murinus]|uniref:hypothetical protein n=1 Tax=Streptomyces murinus TaxID=33900 RepID=UPI003D6775D0